MKKNTHDEQEVSNLLKQLQKSFAEPEKPKKKKADDVDDQKFQEKLAAMLGKLTQPTPKKSNSRKMTRTAEDETIPEPEEPIVEETVIEEPVIEEPVIEEPIVEEPVVTEEIAEEAPVPEKPSAKKKKSTAKRAPKPKKEAPAPMEEVSTDVDMPTEEPQPAQEEVIDIPPESIEEILQEEIQEEIQENLPTVLAEVSDIANVAPSEEEYKSESESQTPLIPTTDNVVETVEEVSTPESPLLSPKNESASTESQYAPASPPQKKPAPQTHKFLESDPIPQRITIAPPQSKILSKNEPPSNLRIESQPDRPIIIKPKNAPSANAAPQKSNSDTIVIRPRVNAAQVAEPIVIQSPTAKKSAPTPQLQTPTAEAAPIKIGKESKSQVIPDAPGDPQKLQKPIMNKKANTTIVPSTAFTKSAKDKPRIDQNIPSAPTVKAVKTPAPSTAPNTVKTKNDPHSKKKPKIDAVSATSAPKAQSSSPKKPSRNSKKRATKQENVEPQLSAMDLVRQRCGLSEDDVAMIFELGYENELGRLVGYENLRQLKNEHLRRIGLTERKHYRTSFGYRGEEYASTNQRDSVIAAYLHDRKPLIARILLTTLCTLLLLFLELPHPQFEVPYLPIVFRLASLLLLGGCAAISSRQIAAGLHSFFKFTPTPYSVPALLVPSSLLYGTITLFIDQPLLRVSFLTALVLLLMAICDLLRFSTELRALKIVSTDEPKITLATAQPRKKKLRVGNKTVKIINDDIDETRYQVHTSMHTVGHFRRFNNMHSASRPFALFIGASFALATMAAFVCAIATSNIGSAISDFITVLLLSAPVCAVFGYFYPLYLANRLLATRGCTLVGDEAVTEYEGNKTIIFRDTDLYTAQRSTEISVRSGDALRRDMTLAGALFRKLGGTLGQMAQAFPMTENGDLSVSVSRVHDNGIEALVDNRYQLLLGSADFLTHFGVKVPKETTDSILRRTSNAGLIYLAIDGSLRLSYEIEYQAQKNFERMIRHLAEAGCVCAIYSYDPNLDEVFLQKSRPNAYGTTAVLKSGLFEENKPAEFTDTGAVAQKNNLDIAFPIYAAYGISKIRHFIKRMQIIAALLGTLLVSLITLFGNGTALGIFAVMGIQLFWITVVCIATHSELNPDKLHFRKKQK